MDQSYFPTRKVSEALYAEILSYIRENNTVLRDAKLREQVLVENQMLRYYIHAANGRPSDCRKAIQRNCAEYQLTDQYIKERAAALMLADASERVAFVEWALKTAERIYFGMAGDNDSLKEAKNDLDCSSSKPLSRFPTKYRMVLFCLFESVPELNRSEEYETLLQFGKEYCKRCLNKIINTAMYDNSSGEEKKQLESGNDIEELRRELFIARKELMDYRELTEAADADLSSRVNIAMQQEFASFFSLLNDRRYGFLIDSVFTQMNSIKNLARQQVPIAKELQSAQMVMEQFILFLKEAGISPATKFPPRSVQYVYPSEMDGATFEADPSRKEQLRDDEKLKVYVVSSGWKYKGTTISKPVFEETGR